MARTFVKIKDGVVRFKKYPPPQELQSNISERMKGERNGYYEVRYEVGRAGDDSLKVKASRTDTPAGKVLKTAGGLAFITLGLMALFR